MSSLEKILVSGANGQLGSELHDLAKLYPAYEFVFATRDQMPLDDTAKTLLFINETKPDVLINCAAYTAVDKAESERDLALQINGTVVGKMAELCEQQNVKFIHISTDYVFDGNSNFPLKEDSKVAPVNYYGESKLTGEQAALKANPHSTIIRTSWVYSYYGKNFVKTMLRLMAEKESLNVVGDQFGSPTYAKDLAEVIMQIIAQGAWQPGIYHFSNDGVITWADFANEIAKLSHSNCKVNAITTEEYPTPAKRPHYSVMDKTKIQAAFTIQLKDWKQSLEACIQKLQADPSQTSRLSHHSNQIVSCAFRIIMKAASAQEIKSALKNLDEKALMELCLRLARYKKENKELLTFLLFEADDLSAYTQSVSEEIDIIFETVNTKTPYFAKKGLRKALRTANKYIRYAGSKTVEVELLLHYCTRFKSLDMNWQKSTTLSKIYDSQLKKIKLAIDALHEDLQYDYLRSLLVLKEKQSSYGNWHKILSGNADQFISKLTNMKKILLGALVCAAVAGVVFYLYDEDKFKDTVDDWKDKADDALGKVKDKFNQKKEAYTDAM